MLPAPVRQETEVPDPHETARKHMQEEATQELLDLQAHDPPLVLVSRITPTEMHPLVCQPYQPMIGDGNAVGVVAQVVESVFRAAEAALGVDDPGLPVALPDQIGEEGTMRAWLHAAGEPQMTIRKDAAQAGRKLSAGNTFLSTFCDGLLLLPGPGQVWMLERRQFGR